jgi:hypothetical protein
MPPPGLHPEAPAYGLPTQLRREPPSHAHRNPTAAEYRGATLQESIDDRRFGETFLKTALRFFRVIDVVE